MRNYSRLKNIVFVLCFFIQLSTQQKDPQIQDADYDLHSEADLFGEGSKQLSEINFLIPIDPCKGAKGCRKAYQTVVAYHGCYEWKISHPNLIDVQPVPGSSHPECTNVVRISSVQPRETKSVIWLTAKDKRSGQALTAAVTVGKVARLEIFARFRQIPKGDRQRLHVRGYDDEGNIFSTLDGFRFDWSEVTGGSNILRISRDQAEYRGQKAAIYRGTQDYNEYKNHGDYFLKAKQNGVTTLEVKMLEKGYEKLASAKITLTIVDPFVILAQESDEDVLEESADAVNYTPAYILPTSSFSFKLALIKNQDQAESRLEMIKTPSSKYLWELGKQFQSLGSIDSKGEFQSLNKPGRAEINVIDQDFKNNTAQAEIFIVEPVQLKLEIADVTEAYLKQAVTNSKTKVSSFRKQLNVTNWAKEWLVVEDKYYLIKAYLYDKDRNRIFQTRQLDFKSTLDSKYFQQVEKNIIGSELIVKVKSLTGSAQSNAAPKTIIRASLNEVKSSQRNKFKIDSSRLKDEKEITVTRPVKIVHPSDLILLPHIKSMGQADVGQIWHVRAVGGAGSYIWRTADPSVASVGQPQQVKSGDVYARDVGRTVLTVADLRNPDNFATIDVEVQPVHHLLWLQDRVEALSQQQTAQGEGTAPQGAPTGSDGMTTLSSIAVDSQKRRFTNCTELKLSYDVKGHGELVGDPSKTNWAQLQKYVRSPQTQELIKLQNQFSQQPDAVFQSDLVGAANANANELQHNNFGICRQIKVKSEGVGLARVKATFDDPERKIESTDAEIASYTNLETVKPEYSTFLQDLYSRSQSGQEFQTFAGFATQSGDSKKPKSFVLSFGSTITLELTGGSHFWGALSGEYKTDWTVKNRKGTTEDVLALGVKSETADSTLITVQCGTPADLKNLDKAFEYTVLITQQGRVSKHLLKPVQHKDSVKIGCAPPESQRLLWAQSPSADLTDAPANLPRSRLHENVRTFSALVNSENYLRLLVLDKKGHASMNHSSIVTTFSTSDSSLATLSEVKGSNEALAADYDKKLVKFHKTGTVVINAVSQKYDGDMMIHTLNKKAGKSSFFGGGGSHSRGSFSQGLFVGHAVREEMRIDIVNNLDIEPKFKSVYFKGNKNPYTFHLSHGSGHFAVKVNDTESLAVVRHIGRQVTIIPRSEGSLLITVEDVDLPESLPVTAELLISNVARLSLDTQGYLIEKGSSTNMTVTALDSYGIEFDEDQYNQMTFEIEIAKTDIEIDKTKGNFGLQIVQILGERRKFNATGIERGHYGVTAQIENFKQGQKTSTMENKIEVFPALRLQPDKLLLTPQMKYTLKVEGGPSRSPYGANAGGGHVVTNFNIENPDVASIDSSNEVTGETVGDSVLRVQIYHIISANQRKDSQEWRSLVSEKQIFVKVRLVTSIAIPDNQQRMVYTGSLLKQLAVLKYKDETFTHGIAPVSFSWDCSNPDILEPNPSLLEPLQYQRSEIDKSGQSRYTHQVVTKTIRDNLNNNAAVFSSSYNSSGIHARALRAGEATLQVTMAIEYPKAYRRDQNWFKTSALLKVQDKLTVAVPEFIPDADKQTHLYLLPPRTTSKISTNKKTRLKLGYSMQSVYDYSSKRYEYREAKTPIIQLVDNEAIRTLDKYGKVTVHIAEDQAWGDQVVMLNVLIADIYSLSATHKHNFYEALSLPLGSTLKMPIKFQNEHAHLFANGIEGVEVGIQLSHPNVVTAQLDRYNQSITLDSQGSGECNVVLYLINNPDIFDVFKVRVATLVQPGSPVHLHVGSQVSFKIVTDSHNGLPAGDIKWSSSAPSTLSIDSQDGTAVALDVGSANVLLSGKKSEMELEAASIAHVSQVTHAEVEQNGWNDLLLDVEEAGHLRIRLKLFLGNQVEELMPVTQYDDVTLIRQNVQLKCQTDQPRYVEAKAEVNDVEGYFCNVRYVGPSRGSHKDTPQRARIKATVSASTSKGRGYTQPRPYTKDLLSFDVALVGRLGVDRKYRKGVKLGQFSRTKQFVVHSLSDFDVRKTLDDKTLKVQRSRDRHDSNDHTISITVTRATNQTLKTEVTLVHRVTGETVVIPVTFDPSDNSGSVYDSPAKPKKQSKPDAQNGKAKKSEEVPGKAPSATAYILFLFLVFLVIILFGQNPNFTIQGLFAGCSRRLQALMNSPAGGYNNDNSREFYSLRGTDASGASSARSRNPMAGVRASVFSPEGKARQRGAPYQRFQQSRGSVVSPLSMQSMYRQVDDSARRSPS